MKNPDNLSKLFLAKPYCPQMAHATFHPHTCQPGLGKENRGTGVCILVGHNILV